LNEDFESLLKGSGICGRGAQHSGLFELAAALGNRELLTQLYDVNEINVKNVCSRMRNGHFCEFCIEEEIAFAASHFDELVFEELKNLDICIVDQILSSPRLRLKDEDSLFELICEFDCESPVLFRHVLSDYLSCETMSVFLDLVCPPAPDPVMWSSLCRRLLLPVWRPPSKLCGTVEILIKEAASLDGIMSYLTKKHGGNVAEKGIVRITAKSAAYDHPAYAVTNVADLTSDVCFWSKNEPDQWVCWDFGEMRVRPTSYTIKAWCLNSWVIDGSLDGTRWTVNAWVIDGSLDGTRWTEIDRRTYKRFFTSCYAVPASFRVSKPAQFRFLRLTQGHTPDYASWLRLRTVEFFGTLFQ
jgi:hypothetical protein